MKNKLRHLLANYNADIPKLFTQAGLAYLAQFQFSESDRFTVDLLLEEMEQHGKRLKEVDAKLRKFARRASVPEREAREVLAVRAKPPNPSELLGSARMREVIEELSHRYERVILDSPAALGLPDAKAISEICEGLIMVIRADVTAARDVEAALELLDRRRILGLLLNGATFEQEPSGYAT